MPRPSRSFEDVWAWAWEKSGIFSVKSAYRELTASEGNVDEGGGSSSGSDATWKLLWKLRVVPKIRIFFWRVLNNILPSCDELKRRHIARLGFCPMCGHDKENLFHAMIECEHAKLFWLEAQEVFDLKMPRLHPDSWAFDILDSKVLEKKKAAIAISVMWTIWGSRNKFHHEEEQYQPRRSMELVQELVRSLELPRDDETVVVVDNSRWKPPDSGWVKINTDGAIDSRQNCAGAGIVARDEGGSFVIARARRYKQISDPFTIELLALCPSLHFGSHRLRLVFSYPRYMDPATPSWGNSI